MKNKNNNFLKILAVLLIAVSIIAIFKAGYKTGGWLYSIFH
jgi:hypothetical protein